MFAEAYVGVMQHFRGGGWYHDADIFTGQPTHIQFQSLQSFWPGESGGLCCHMAATVAGSTRPRSQWQQLLLAGQGRLMAMKWPGCPGSGMVAQWCG